ncbi:hypothetical protein QN277_024102 [Acacia crassicarpa]|uniref:AAA+ ATPase domain-containing protein n=1 Tax=Acacia crassicarpa TaxID=499986 RepID=A0AAE1K743_9FABA|nr:hypothetical protein QN277_024102 [Acacia crassicarpa]
MVDIASLTWDLVKDALRVVGKGLEYKSTRNNLEAAVKNLTPRVDEIEHSMKRMNLSTELIEELKDILAKNREALGKNKIHWWNCFLAPLSQVKLSKEHTSLERYFSVQTQLQMFQLLLKILVVVSPQCPNNDRTVMLKDDERLPPRFIVGLDGRYMEEMKDKLLDAHEQVLNLYGLPGSGKTTMARKLCKNLEDEGKFKGVIFVTLGSQIKVEEAMIKELQEKVSEYGKDSVLLVLDDVWPHSEDIVEKINLKSSASRILVTSRAQMTTVTSRCQMKLLSDQDAENLLRGSIQLNANFDDPQRHKILLQIVEGCKGLPLALKFIGRKIAKKNGTIEAFEEVQSEWSQGGSILDSHEDFLARLQNSVDESIKDHFLDLGLFPEDQKIPITSLIDMWTELHDLKESASSSSAYLIIQELITMNLADQVIVRRTIGCDDLDKYYNNQELVQHDLFRELAIHMSKQEPLEKRRRLIIDLYGNQNHPPEWWPKQQPSLYGKKSKKLSVASHILSISTDQNITPDWCNNIKAAATVVLVLNLRTSEYTLPKFIKKMKNLKVLIVTNYGYSKTDLRNLQLLGSLLSLKRIRLQKVSIPSLCDLKNVYKLSLYMCDVKKAFENSSFNFSKAMPKLEDLSIEYCQDLVELPTGFCLILTMKNLTITSCHNFIRLAEEIGNLKNLELLRINHCSAFEKIPDSITELKNLSLLDMSFCGSLRKLPDNIGELHNLGKLYMKGCSSIQELPESVIRLNKLESVTCDEDVFSSWKDFTSCFSRLNIKTADDMDVNLNWLS